MSAPAGVPAAVGVVEVLRPGLLTTVQDLGRAGLGSAGVSPSGAMDPAALRLANAAAGNVPGAPALELTGPGASLRFLGPALFALGGADLGATLDGAPVPLLTPVRTRAGAVLSLTRRVRGFRVVLAVGGGFDAPLALGSAATDLDAGLGAGRLAAGARLRLAGPGRDGRAIQGAPALLAALYHPADLLRLVPSDEPATAAAREALAALAFRVSDRSNRTGYRLVGPPLPVLPTPGRLSEPVAPGALQLPPDGQPILLMADRQTTGGYPVIGHLAAVDRGRAAQLAPGDPVRFASISAGEARAAARALDRALVSAEVV